MISFAALGLSMRQTPLCCRKCRIGSCQEGDTWCLLCSCVQTLNELSKHRFNLPAHRAFGEELVFQTTRQLQAVVTLDRQVHSQVTSLTDRLNNTTFKLKEAEAVNQASAKSAPRRSQSVREPPPKEEPEEERREAPPGEAVDYGSPASSVSPSPGDKKAEEPPRESKRGSERPPEPSYPPSAPAPEKRDRSRSRRRGRRGGEKHQEIHRGLYEPDRNFHQRLHLPPLDLGGERDSHRRRKR